jgi:type III pantothenate kinase
MPETRLLIDLGNSRVKWLWSRGVELDLESAGQGDLAAFEQACRARGAVRPSRVLVSSVAGEERTTRVVDCCVGLWGLRPTLLVAQAESRGVRNGYAEPARLGVDRWLAIVGAVHHHGKPVVVWDLGTAATLDVVDETGQHLGGWILPGPTTMLESLGRRTALPPTPQWDRFATVEPCRNTADAIRAGVLGAQVGALQRFLGRVAGRIGQTPQLVITGGAAPGVTQWLDIDFAEDPWLVFRGMAIV